MLIHRHTHTSFDPVLRLWPASPRPLRVCLGPDSAAVLGNGLELREMRGGERLAGWIISRSHCPGTGVLNQPQVADKRIWIESRRGALPAAASGRRRCRSRAGYTVIGFSGTRFKRLMRKEKALSPPLSSSPSSSLSLSNCLSLCTSSPRPPWVSQGSSYFENTGPACEGELSLSVSTIIWHTIPAPWWRVAAFTCVTGALEGSLARHQLSQVSHASEKHY